MQEQQAKQQKKPARSRRCNEKLDAAKTARDGGDYDTAIADLTEATQIDATRDVLWFKLGDEYRLSATKQTDTAEKQKRYDSAVEAYQKAIDLQEGRYQRQRSQRGTNLAGYYNNMAEAYAKSGKTDDAVKTYERRRRPIRLTPASTTSILAPC